MAILLRREWLWLILSMLLVMLVIFYASNNSIQQLADELEINGDLEEVEKGREEISAAEEAEELNQQPVNDPYNNSDFFVEYRLERERVRSQQMDMLREIVHNPNADAENRKEAHRILLEISQRLELEMEAEGLIKAKGFRDAVVFFNEERIHVIVKADQLKAAQVAQIGDLITGMYGVSLEHIIIDCHP
ncbi:MAG: SpoIIIAH-like family protein [bacterium]|jgi:stage III sporulation protein AH